MAIKLDQIECPSRPGSSRSPRFCQQKLPRLPACQGVQAVRVRRPRAPPRGSHPHNLTRLGASRHPLPLQRLRRARCSRNRGSPPNGPGTQGRAEGAGYLRQNVDCSNLERFSTLDVEMHRRLHTTRGLHCTRPSRMASCKVPRRSCYLTISGPWPLALAPQGDRRAALRLAIAGWTLPAGEEWDEHPCGEDDFAEHTQRPGPTARQP